jgi:tetratricopeptide (TPR) repeat protein
VTAERPHGEAEAINRERTAENILQVLPHDVITSLPNANVADAIGRLPNVTLERDEGDGKYVQIHGTEPRFSNVTIDGVNVPAPESGVRQIKLDIIPSDLVESVEINKTLLANMDGDGIGYAPAYYNLGNVLEEQKKYDEAIAEYQKAIRC